MNFCYGIVIILLAFFSGFTFAHSDSSDDDYIYAFTGIATNQTIQVEAYRPDIGGEQIICFDLKSQQYRKCGTDDTEALHNIPIYYDLVGTTGDKMFCFDRNNEVYISCLSLNEDHKFIHIPEGFELAAATDYEYGHVTFYCRWLENPTLTIDCDLASHNQAPDSEYALKIPPGKVVAGVSQDHKNPSSSCGSNHHVEKNVYFISLEDYQRLKVGLNKRWDDYKKAFPERR